MKQVELVVFDLDNTLYDWYSAFLPAFYSMVDVACSLLACDREALLDELKAVHIKHHDVEHPFSLLETPTVQSLIDKKGQKQVRDLLDPAFHAFNKERKQHLSLFPGVLDTLNELRSRSIRLIAFTDSKYYAALGRVNRMGLTDHFSRIYCRERSKSILPQTAQDSYAKFVDKVRELPPHETKPDPRVLSDIARHEDASLSGMAYIGDSIAKDVVMAKRAGCFAIWAEYGATIDQALYASLVRISHWTAEDVEREKKYAAEAKLIAPDFICRNSLAEVLTILTGY